MTVETDRLIAAAPASVQEEVFERAVHAQRMRVEVAATRPL